MKRIATLLVCGTISVLPLAAAAADGDTCEPVSALPATIADSGVYCVTANLATSQTSGAAVAILADNVVLDLAGHTLDGSAAGNGTLTYGVNVSQRRNVVVKNGVIRGFHMAIYIADGAPWTASQGNVVEGVQADRNTYAGLVVMGSGNLVRRNNVIATGGSTAPGFDSAVAIQTNGVGNRILENDVMTVTARPGGGAWGVSITGSDNLVCGNRVTNTQYGLYFNTGAGKYCDTLTSGVTVPYTGGVPAWHND